ncbi:DUF1439 domain-containing protein [Vibrio pomeroyi]|uniref:DUF1439 domain-containing protein n=1 Tax=Vibrio pomeroyi TaxID=198832 RepID=UPI0035A6F57F
MIINVAKKFILAASALILGGCVSYSVTEQEMTNYLQDSVMLEQEVGVQNVMYAQVAVDDLAVQIGRADAERVSVLANTNAKVQESLIKSSEPNLVIRDNKLVIELFD